MVDRDEDGQQPCRRLDWCASSTIVNDNPDGGGRRVPAYGPRAFCDRDATLVARSLEELPAQYAHLAAEIGSPSGRASAIRVPFGPRVPLRVDVDALMRLLHECLISWHERVAAVDHLSFPDERRRPGAAVQRAVDVLSGRVTALLALAPEPMARAVSLSDLASWPEDTPGVVHAAFAEVIMDLDGGDAGMEILNLRHLCRAVLGETRSKPQELIGVPCRADECGLRALVRAEPPSDPADEGAYSECMACGDRMAETEYREWVALCAAYERNKRRKPATLGNLPGVA